MDEVINKTVMEITGDEYSSYEYRDSCDACGKQIIVCTQRDNDAEYMTLIYVLCSCGKGVGTFAIPVN